MQHGNHKFNTAFEMAMATICAFSPSKYTLPHWKCVFLCCVKYPHIDLPSPESDQHNFNASPTICFHAYHLIARCDVHGRGPFYENKQCQLCEATSD